MDKSSRILIKCLILFLFVFFSLTLCKASESSAPTGEERLLFKKKYTFTAKWFPQNIPTWEKILRDFKGKPDVHYLEIGLFEGCSFFWMLENILTHPTSTATGIDPFPKAKVEKVFMSNLELSGFKNKVKVLKTWSQEVLRKLPDNSFDIIYIDGDHSAAGVLVNAIFCWPLLKKGGLLIIDDYLWHNNNDKKPPREKPKIAVDAFLSSLELQMDVVIKSYQVIIRKKKFLYWEKTENTK